MERRQILRQEQVRKAVFNSSDQLKNCCSLPLIKVKCEYKFPIKENKQKSNLSAFAFLLWKKIKASWVPFWGLYCLRFHHRKLCFKNQSSLIFRMHSKVCFLGLSCKQQLILRENFVFAPANFCAKEFRVCVFGDRLSALAAVKSPECNRDQSTFCFIFQMPFPQSGIAHTCHFFYFCSLPF